MYQTEKCDVDADSFSSTSSFSDSDNDSDDLAEGITVLTVGGNVVDLSQGQSSSTVIQTPGLRTIQIGQGRCTIVGTSDRKHGRRKQHRKEKSPPRHRAPKLSESKHPPTKDDLSHVCNNIGRRWRKLAFSLGLSRGPVECIEEDFRHEGCYEMAWQALLTWRRQHGDAATLGELVQALDDIGLAKLASELPM